MEMYETVKLTVVILGMMLVGVSCSACGVKMGENSMIGTPSFIETVYKGEIALKKERVELRK